MKFMKTLIVDFIVQFISLILSELVGTKGIIEQLYLGCNFDNLFSANFSFKEGKPQQS